MHLAVTDRSPGLRVQYSQIARNQFGDQPGQQLTAQVLSDAHRHGAVGVDDQRIQRAIGTEGREPGQPIVLVAERGMNLFDAGGRFERHLE